MLRKLAATALIAALALAAAADAGAADKKKKKDAAPAPPFTAPAGLSRETVSETVAPGGTSTCT